MGKSAGQKRVNRMKFVRSLCMADRCKMEELAHRNPDLSDAELLQIREYYAREKLQTELPKIGALVIAPNSCFTSQILEVFLTYQIDRPDPTRSQMMKNFAAFFFQNCSNLTKTK